MNSNQKINQSQDTLPNQKSSPQFALANVPPPGNKIVAVGNSIIDHQSSIPAPPINPLEAYLASLSEVADIFQLPTQPPPIAQFRQLFDQRMDQLETEFQQRDPSDPNLETHRAAYQKARTRLWNKILQLNEAYRKTIGLNLPTEFPLPNPQPPVPATSAVPAVPVVLSATPSAICNLPSALPEAPPDPAICIVPPAIPEEAPQIFDDEDDYKSQCALANFFGKPKPILNIPSENGFAQSLIHEPAADENEPVVAFLSAHFGHECAEITPEEAARLEEKYQGPFFQPEPTQPMNDQPLNPSHPPQSDPATPPRHPATNSTFALATRDNVAPRRADHSPLDDISPINQETIIALLARGHSTRKLAKLISSPPPDGLGIPTTKDSVQRFERRYKTREAILEQRIHDEAARQLTDAIGERDAFIPATSRLIQKQLFETTLNTQLPLDQLTHLTRTLARLHTLQINDRKLALAEQKALAAESAEPSPKDSK